MELTTSEKIKIILGRKNMSMSDLADALGQTRQNLHNKMKRDNFSEKELQEIAAALNVGFESYFVLEEGEKI
ncbi:helix-turn-helix domain-containing protein [Lysinibacillus macroides]|uniref:Transcriptional regulator n=1 Tax=Lysinibacillus macroides TaxID=33935 RepID=A0A0N0CVB8_9BACI|nr:helix-turn-helix transcriptional regulator [Lysinibacillus macroides]KOY81244.1 transcriptional regulator [Lysinibacillus macroides]QPR68602.1 helix-turn-helix domain-containing protein [Lysinibacillus macroides]